MLELEVSGQRLRCKKALFVVADSVNYLKVRLTFSADWDGLVKTAIFKDASKENVYHVLLDSDGVCTVPWEVISAPRFYISVFGGERITTNDCEIQCSLSGYKNGGEPSTPTGDIYEQIISIIEGIHIPTNVSEFTNDAGYLTTAMLLDYNYVTSTELQELENTLNEALSSAISSLGNGINAVNERVTDHKFAMVLDHADGSVITSKIKDKAVTAEKIADGVIPTVLPANGGDADTVGGKTPGEFAASDHTHSELHTHDNKLVIDKLSESENGKLMFDGEEISGSSSGSSEVYDITPLSEFAGSSAGTYSFPYETDEEFAVENDLEEDIDSLIAGGDPVWNFSQTLKAGKSYLLSIAVQPVTGAEWNNGEITVIKEVSASDLPSRVTALEERMDSIEATVGNANDVLETLLTEGV